jgi:hypothetical protein
MVACARNAVWLVKKGYRSVMDLPIVLRTPQMRPWRSHSTMLMVVFLRLVLNTCWFHLRKFLISVSCISRSLQRSECFARLREPATDRSIQQKLCSILQQVRVHTIYDPPQHTYSIAIETNSLAQHSHSYIPLSFRCNHHSSLHHSETIILVTVNKWYNYAQGKVGHPDSNSGHLLLMQGPPEICK